MVYIKKLIMHGFKSFARRTEIPFDQGINVILGPNGSGKSNVADALCFVLGRLSIKSMRAAKARNLLFMGSKYVKPAREASVELVFDNKDRSFSLDRDEVVIKRTVKYNGQGGYKINDENKTRLEIIEMLAQAGIDPYGFNLILQGQIQSVVKMHADDRRKIIEEVAGISIYESRKEKALGELEKTQERLKEISAILRERTAYLRNLDREREQALKFKDLEMTVKRAKATILNKKKQEKEKELGSMLKSIEEKSIQKDKIKKEAEKIQEEINKLTENINQISKHIQQATGLEQETLHNQIANLKAEMEGLKVRKENYENRRIEIEKRIGEMQKSIPSLELEIAELKKESPMMAKKAEELRKKKEELANIEEERKKRQGIKSELGGVKERIKDKEHQLSLAIVESEHLLHQLEDYLSAVKFKTAEECQAFIDSGRKTIHEKRNEYDKINAKILENEKEISIAESEIKKAERIKLDVEKIDFCPLCQSTITSDHKKHVDDEENRIINEAKESMNKAREELKNHQSLFNLLIKEIKEIEIKISSAEIELFKHKSIKDKNEQLKKRVDDEHRLKEELIGLESRRKQLEEKTLDISNIDERYDSKMLEIEEISSRTEEDVDTTILYKERELENMRNIIKRSGKDKEEIEGDIRELVSNLTKRHESLGTKEKQEKELQERFNKLFESRERSQREIQDKNLSLSEYQNEVRAVEDQINYLKIGKARLDAEKEAVEMELVEFSDVELIQGSISVVEERLKKAQESMQQIGGINMRALEVYEEVKKSYDEVQAKVDTLDKEKQDIMSIIEEIDRKKKTSFMKTFRAINTLFSENFSKLSSKGIAFLEMESKEEKDKEKEENFEGGVNIVVKMAKGKYFDVTSLSGGEQTLVALSLLFAIQEHKPYHFYVFDEIDAALDKRNSERLAALLNQYMKAGQYIVITHNDAIITNSNVLYGVSMHDGVSKTLSLKIGSDVPNEFKSPATPAVPPHINIDDSAPLSSQTNEEQESGEEDTLLP